MWADFLRNVLPCVRVRGHRPWREAPRGVFSAASHWRALPPGRRAVGIRTSPWLKTMRLMSLEGIRTSPWLKAMRLMNLEEGVGLPSDLKQMVNRWDKVGSTDFYRYLFEGPLGDYFKGPKIRGPLPWKSVIARAWDRPAVFVLCRMFVPANRIG